MDDRRLTTLLERTYPGAPIPPLERLEQRAAAIRRRRRTLRAACAVAAAAIVVLGVVVTLPGIDRESIETPARPVPNTIPDVSKTHAIVVTPSTGLRDRQLVRVSGRFAPPIGAEHDIGVQTCRVGVTPLTENNDCDGTTRQYSRPPHTPLLRRYPYMVRRTITIGGQSVDCAATPGCVLYAVSRDRLKGQPRYPDKYGVAPLAFDPTASPRPGPTVTVTPHHGLRDGDAVTVRAHHFRPFAGVGVTVCSDGTDVCDVVDVPQQRIGPNASLSVTHGVWSVFVSADGTLHDCRSVACVVRFGPSDRSIDVPISFSPRKRAASYPQLNLDPAGPYTDGQQVTVTVNGWPGSIGHRPDLAIEHLTVGQCAGATCVGATSLRREPDGRYTATLALHRTGPPEGMLTGPTDCTQPGNCQVALVLTPRDSAPSVILAVDVVVT
jgi:hypothetical protein